MQITRHDMRVYDVHGVPFEMQRNKNNFCMGMKVVCIVFIMCNTLTTTLDLFFVADGGSIFMPQASTKRESSVV
jgi:hypothetical protein